MSRESRDRPSPCPLCGGPARPRWPGEPVVLACSACGAAHLAEFPAEDETRALYQDAYYREETGERFVGVVDRAIVVLAWLRYRAIARRQQGPGSILDVGCGRGDLLELFRQRGWQVLGTQLSQTAAQAAGRQRGVEVRCAELPALGLGPRTRDVVTLFHVLEHLRDPALYLACVRDILVDDGLLVVEVPNFASFGFRTLGRRDLCFDYPQHLFFFTPGSLEGLLRRAGFRVEASTFFCLPYSPYTTLQNALNLLPGVPNRLYRSLQQNEEGLRLRRSPWTWAHLALAAGLAAPAAIFSLAGLLAPIGNTLRFYCRKRSGG